MLSLKTNSSRDFFHVHSWPWSSYEKIVDYLLCDILFRLFFPPDSKRVCYTLGVLHLDILVPNFYFFLFTFSPIIPSWFLDPE